MKKENTQDIKKKHVVKRAQQELLNNAIEELISTIESKKKKPLKAA